MGPYSTALAALARKIREKDARKVKKRQESIVDYRTSDMSHLNGTYHNAATDFGPPAYAENYYMLPLLPVSEMNYHILTGYGPPPSAYTTATRLAVISPISPAESDTDSESNTETSYSSDSEAFSTPIKPAAATYMLETYLGTPTTSDKRIIRGRHLNFHDPNLIYDLENISEDENNDGEPMAKKSMNGEDIMVNKSMGAWLDALARMYKSINE